MSKQHHSEEKCTRIRFEYEAIRDGWQIVHGIVRARSVKEARARAQRRVGRHARSLSVCAVV